jgi:hypothetical protein
LIELNAVNPLAPRICSGSAESALLFFWGFVVGNIGDEYIKEAVFRTTSSSSKIFPASARMADEAEDTLPTLEEACNVARPREIPSCHVLWGPISAEMSERAGAEFASSSVLLRPFFPAGVVDSAMGVVPEDVFPTKFDTVETLRARLAKSTFLEDSHVLKDGSGPKRVRLNATSYPQPRRRSWSVVVEQRSEEDDHLDLLCYTAYGREPSDWEAVPMPRPVFDLGCCCWAAAFPYLTEQSKATPPTGCQLLLYYVLFDSSIGRHRDNYNKKHLLSVVEGKRSASSIQEGNHHGGDANSQMLGSNVLVYTHGDADMTFALSFCPPNNHKATLEEYIIHPIFCAKMGTGTLLVFQPLDDLLFCHEAFFEDVSTGTCRAAFVFRWLTQTRRFSAATGKMKMSSQLTEKCEAQQANKRRKKEREKRAALQCYR